MIDRAIEHRLVTCPVSRIGIHRASNGRREITGYAAVYYDPDDLGTEYYLGFGVIERIMPGAFNRALLEKHDVRALFNHDANLLLGRFSAGTLRLSSDKKGLRYAISEDPDDPHHQAVIAKIERGDLTGSSFSFYARQVSWVEGPSESIRQVEDLDLVDVAPVTFPAYEATTVTAGLRTGSRRRPATPSGQTREDQAEAERIDIDLRLAQVTAEN